MAPLEEVHAHEGVARLHQRFQNGEVAGRARQRLHVDVNLLGWDSVGGEESRGSPLCQALDKVYIINALLEPSVRIAPVVDQLPICLEQGGFVILAHAGGGIAFRVDVIED